nr:TetR/AcrR family transcriptional regulator C-terminal domain-containing protein [Kitasatospora aureofaciens]
MGSLTPQDGPDPREDHRRRPRLRRRARPRRALQPQARRGARLRGHDALPLRPQQGRPARRDGRTPPGVLRGDLFAEPNGPWTEVVREFAVSLRRMLLDHPAVLTVLATRPAAAPATLTLIERGITVLREDGVPLADALAVLNPVVMWTLGRTLSEVGETPHHEGTEPRPEQLSALDRTTCPHLARAFGTGEGLDSERRFHRTLRNLLAGYAAESDVTEGAGNRPANAPG